MSVSTMAVLNGLAHDMLTALSLSPAKYYCCTPIVDNVLLLQQKKKKLTAPTADG